MEINLAVLIAMAFVSAKAVPQVVDSQVIGLSNLDSGTTNSIAGNAVSLAVDTNGNPFPATGSNLIVSTNQVGTAGNLAGTANTVQDNGVRLLAQIANGNQIDENGNVFPPPTDAFGNRVSASNVITDGQNRIAIIGADGTVSFVPGNGNAVPNANTVSTANTLGNQLSLATLLGSLSNNNNNNSNSNNILGRLFSGPVSGQPRCPRNEIFLACGPGCTRTCGNFLLQRTCTTQCRPGCFCIEGMVRDEWRRGVCVWPYRCRALRRRPNRRDSSEENHRKKSRGSRSSSEGSNERGRLIV